MNFCPQCGTRFEPEARFCQECGFDINSVISINELIPKPIIEPIIQPEVVAATILPPLQTEILPTPAEPPRFSTDKTTPPVMRGELVLQKKTKTLWIWIVLAVIILSVAGWYAYNTNILSKKYMPFTIDSNNFITENSVEKQTEQAAKPMSLMDQELAKQKAKEVHQNTSKDNSKEENVETNTSENDIIPEIILEVGHKEEPKSKNPKNPAKLTLQKPTMITRITTDHYNDGMGTPRGGKITIKDKNDKIVGSFKALGKTGKNGTPSAKWVAEPNIMLQKGTYFISDSEMATWSKTLVGGNGFVVVEGYEVE